MAKLVEKRECPYCGCYISSNEDKSLDVHYTHTKRHTKQYFHYHCWRAEMDKRVKDQERIKRNNEERNKRRIEYFANREEQNNE